jgi:vacuolar protein sorting-associated protein 13A/C
MIFLTVDVRHGSAILYWDIPFSCHFSEPRVNIEIREQKKGYHISSLSAQMTNEYMSQLKRRIFKVIGSLDILGNPTGYVSSIGEGFIQLFEAPRKGLINGPLGFGEGVAKGFGTLLNNIISGAFDAVGKISGTLLASCEMLQGEKAVEQLEDREPDNVLDGIYKGVKEGLLDLGKGIGGIVFKPFEGAKKEGVKGFFKGLGTGLIGAVVSPFTATFRIANNLFVGIKNTANMFNPKLKTERFRFPRPIEKAIGLKSYNEDKATVRAILDFLKEYKEHEIVYFKQFTYISPGLEGSPSTLILTDKCVMVVYQAKEVVFQIQLRQINNVEIHRENNNYSIIFYLRNNTREYITTKDKDLCGDFYLMFEKTKE